MSEKEKTLKLHVGNGGPAKKLGKRAIHHPALRQTSTRKNGDATVNPPTVGRASHILRAHLQELYLQVRHTFRRIP